MPSLLDIRRRIRAVKSTQQITKAMKMVAASRLRRAQERIQQARPFATQMLRVLNSLATRVDPGSHPLLDERHEQRAGGKALLFVITADRGLCGSFNTNAIKAAGNFITEDAGRQVALGLIGRRGRDFFARRGFEVRYEQVNLFAGAAVRARPRHRRGRDRGVRRGPGRQRVSRLQRVQVGHAAAGRGRALLPIPRLDIEAPAPGATDGPTDRTISTSRRRRSSSRTLLPRHVEVQVFRALLESNAAFYAAQMTAMDAATRNSADMIEQLTLYMNKVRQAAITREIIEVVSGAQAL